MVLKGQHLRTYQVEPENAAQRDGVSTNCADLERKKETVSRRCLGETSESRPYSGSVRCANCRQVLLSTYSLWQLNRARVNFKDATAACQYETKTEV